MFDPAAGPVPPSGSGTVAAPLPFPFAALRGQPEMRLALLLVALDPAIGGVLIEGPRGSAKSTAARALAELLPGAPFVTLPLGASLEHLVGSLDLAEALGDHALRFRPGLLARADAGVLYVDEVNLLPDALVDALLDAAASGLNTVERDGISQRHRARFALVGTMNPDEGRLRPQLLDRFGLSVALRAISDPQERQAIVRQRLAFDADPEGFRTRYADEQAALGGRLEQARARLAGLPLDAAEAVHARVAEHCLGAGIEGLRGDLAMLRAARALAALDGASEPGVSHVDRVAALVLHHRMLVPPTPPSTTPSTTTGAPPAPAASPQDSSDPGSGHSGASEAEPGEEGQTDWGALPAEAVGLTPVRLSTQAFPPAPKTAKKR